MTKDFNILVNKLKSFRLKYYVFQLSRGVILTGLVFIVLFTVFSIVEYEVYLASGIRKTGLFGGSLFCGLIFVWFVLVPLLKMFSLLKPIDIKSSTVLIQKHFPEIKDRLLNIIELSENKEEQYSNEILFASIDQKIKDIKVYNFGDAIQYKDIRNITLFLVFSIFVSGGIYFFNKNIYTASAERILHYNHTFIKPAPYQFKLVNTSLKAKKGESFKIAVTAEGDEIPQLVYINIGGNNYLMKTNSIGNYEFEMDAVINGVEFYFTDLKHHSETYLLELLPKPAIVNFTAEVNSPAYTRIEHQVFNNIGDFKLVNGSKLKWSFKGIDVDSLFVQFNDSVKVYADRREDLFHLERSFTKSTNYNVFVKNKSTETELALSYFIEVIPDNYPEIEVVAIQDSIKVTRFFYKGIIGDDYGFQSLNFHYNVNNEDSAVNIPIIKSLSDQEFYYSFDFSELENPEGIISYYFAVTDNDAVNGFKTTTSSSFTFQFPDEEQIASHEKEQFDKLTNMLQQSQQLTGEIKKDLKNLQLKNMDSSLSDWDKAQMAKDIVQKQNKLENLYDQIKQDNERLNNYLNSFKGDNKELYEKQKQIEELLDEVFTEELKNLMEEFNKLAEEFDSKKLNQLTKDMDLTFDDLQKQLDRNLEMLKKMKAEQKFQEAIDKVSKLASEQERLAEMVFINKNFEEVNSKIEDHKEELKEIQKTINEALEFNSELKEPMNLDDFEDELTAVKESIKDTQNHLEKKNKKKSSAGLKKSAEQLHNTAFAMQQMLDMNTKQQNTENIQNLRQILSNLMYISFNQEEVLKSIQSIHAKDPLLVELNQKQKRLIGQTQIVRDSLYALAMRTPSLSTTVNNELINLELNLDRASEAMEEGLFPQARSRQQFTITAANNLALILNESLENLEKQQANGQPGDQQCENPGGSKPGFGQMKESSRGLKEQLQKMIEQMKNGNTQGMGKQFGKSLMQHEMMQQMLRDLMNNGEVGSGTKKTLQEIDKLLDQNRRELMSKSINARTIKRQNLISTRLLEAERAELEREYEDKRDSESAEDFYSNPVEFFKYKEKDNFTIEYLNKDSHKLSNFYNKKYKKYLNNVEKLSD